jgi:hypothetical protein
MVTTFILAALVALFITLVVLLVLGLCHAAATPVTPVALDMTEEEWDAIWGGKYAN